MHRCNQRTTLGHWLEYTTALWIIGVLSFLCFVVFGFVVVVFGPDPDPIRDAYRRQHDAVAVFTQDGKAADPQARKQLAQTLISVNQQRVPVDMLKNDKVLAQVKHIAASGDRIDLQPKPWNFWEANRLTVLIFGSIYGFLVVILLCSSHLDYARTHETRYSDLPWLAIWPWVLLALSPPLIGYIALEAAQLRLETRRNKRAARAQATE